MNKKLTFNYFKNVERRRPYKTEQLTLEDFCRMASSWEHVSVEDKKRGEAFSMCQYRKGGGRTAEDVESMSAIILDIDQGVSEDQMAALSRTLAHKANVVYSTFSSEPGKYKLRVILPLAAPMLREDYVERNLTLRAAKMIGIPIDKASLNVTQLYFMPICPLGKDEEHGVDVGGSREGWVDADLPEWGPGDELRYLDKTAKSAHGPKRQTKEPSKREVFQQIDHLVTKPFGGVAPIYSEHAFHLYEHGCWFPYEPKVLTKHLMTSVFQESVGLEELSVLIEYMKIRYLEPTFPEALGDDGKALPPLICLSNVTIDPFSGDVVDQSPKHYLRSRMDYAFEPEATCGQWLKYLAEVFEPDTDREKKIDFLQEFIGYLLIPNTKFQVMLWLLGQGDNGKSVVLDVISLLLGKNNVAAIPLERLSKRFQAAELSGKLVNLVHEVSTDGCLQDDILKQAVSGNLIQGERKNKDPFVFRPYARFVVAMNNLPRIKDTSHGFFRRIRLLTFNRIFKREEQDRGLVEKLKPELPGIFVWALEGLQRLWEQGDFTVVPSSVGAVDQFKKECNPVALFVNDLVIRTDILALQKNGGRSIAKTLIHDAYLTYRAYCQAKGFQPISDARFGREMSALGFVASKSSGKRYYQLTLRKPEDVGINGMVTPQVSRLTPLDDAFDRDDPAPMAA